MDILVPVPVAVINPAPRWGGAERSRNFASAAALPCFAMSIIIMRNMLYII